MDILKINSTSSSDKLFNFTEKDLDEIFDERVLSAGYLLGWDVDPVEIKKINALNSKLKKKFDSKLKNLLNKNGHSKLKEKKNNAYHSNLKAIENNTYHSKLKATENKLADIKNNISDSILDLKDNNNVFNPKLQSVIKSKLKATDSHGLYPELINIEKYRGLFYVVLVLYGFVDYFDHFLKKIGQTMNETKQETNEALGHSKSLSPIIERLKNISSSTYPNPTISATHATTPANAPYKAATLGDPCNKSGFSCALSDGNFTNLLKVFQEGGWTTGGVSIDDLKKGGNNLDKSVADLEEMKQLMDQKVIYLNSIDVRTSALLQISQTSYNAYTQLAATTISTMKSIILGIIQKF